MALTVGTAPFGKQTAGTFNFEYDGPGRVLYWEPSPRKVRAVIGGEAVAESSRPMILYETGLMPVYYFPEHDVRMDLLEPTERLTTCPFKGQAVYWTVRAGGEERPDAVWSYPDPKDECPPIGGHLAFRWGDVDEWWEEAERITVHPRDPYHRCDAIESDRRVVVRLGGEVIARSSRPVIVFETGLPPRFYLPEVDVDQRLLAPNDHRTECPYKGVTSRYYDVVADGERIEAGAWVYDFPKPEVGRIAGRVAFYNEKFDLEIDGEAWERPQTAFS